MVAPLAKVLLMFSTQPLAPGTVVGPPPVAPRLESYSPTILIDLTSANQRDVCFDVDAGWSWGGFAWAQTCQAGANVVPLLIETTAAGFRRRARVLRS